MVLDVDCENSISWRFRNFNEDVVVEGKVVVDGLAYFEVKTALQIVLSVDAWLG